MRRALAALLASAAIGVSTRAPGAQDETARDGGARYQVRCAECHGIDAKGVHGPDLTAVAASGASDERLFQTIRAGVPGTEMPGSSAPDAELRAIVAYLRTLAPAPTEASTGNAAHGERLFWPSCGSCHRVNGRGGRLGPDLSRIGARAPRAVLVREIRSPSETIAPGYGSVTVVTREGERVRGVRKSEDAFSIQIMDTRETLRGFRKDDLRELTADPESLMPAFGPDRLHERDLDDLVAFLATLRGAADGPTESSSLRGLVTDADLLGGLRNPSRWLMYSGDYTGQRHSPLTTITPANVARLALQWTFQSDTLARGRGFEATPIAIDGVLYVTGSNNLAWAIDARTGRAFWRYRRELPADLTSGTVYPVNRGFAVLGDRLFMTTLDAHLLALDRATGAVVWDAVLADYKAGYSATLAPLVVKGLVVVGISGGEDPTRGFIDAYDASTGRRVWRTYTVPAAGERGSDTWPAADVMARGGGAAWMTGSYDPQLNLLYWGTGNPNPDFYGSERTGDNLYTCSLLALDAATGRIAWYYQFTPHDTHDWDSVHVPVLADVAIGGRMRKTVMVANRNGFFYVLDRKTGELLHATPFVSTNWAKEIGKDGRPIVLNDDGRTSCLPDFHGGTNFMPPSYDPERRLFFVTARETCVAYFPVKPEIRTGESSVGGGVRRIGETAYGALRALDPSTGERRWEFRYATPSLAGVTSTASGVVFAGDNEGNFMALDALTGRNLWHYQTGAPIWGAAATTYVLDGRQFVLIPSGTTLLAFALPE